MANRHSVQAKAKGGGVKPKTDANKEEYTGKGSHLMKEAKERKRGGKVECKASGGKAMPRLDKRARGGGVGKDMTSSPFSGAHIKGAEGAASNPGVHKGK